MFRAKTTGGRRGHEEQARSRWILGDKFVIGSEGAKLSPVLSDFFSETKKKSSRGMDVIEERKLHCTISSAWQLRGAVDY